MKSKKIAYLLWFFFGWFGIHRFYCRKWFTGVLWLLTLGLFGIGWGADVILTSKLVDDVNGLPEQMVASKFRNELRCFCLMFGGPLVGFLLVCSAASWISQKLDKRTPAQRARDAQEKVVREYREIQRGFPSMKLDGKVVSANIHWSDDEMIFIVPKTYGFMATRFAQESARVSRNAFRRNAEEYADHYFVNVPVKVWHGPSECPSSCFIAVPKSMVPVSFRQPETSRVQPEAVPTVAQQSRSTPANHRATTHNDSTYGYTLSYPSSWHPPKKEWRRVLHEQATDRKILFMAVSPDQKLNLQVWVFNEPPAEGDSLEMLLEEMFKNSPFPKENAKTNIIETAGGKAIRYLVDTTTPVGQPARFVYVLMIRDGRVWTFGIGGNRIRFQENQKAIYDIVKSISFGSQK